MQKKPILIPSGFPSLNSPRNNDTSYRHSISNISPNHNYLNSFDSKKQYNANTNNGRKKLSDNETKSDVNNIKNIKYSKVNESSDIIINNKQTKKNVVKQENLVSLKEKNKSNNIIFNGNKNIINNNNNIKNKQRTNNNHSFFESKYVLKPNNSFLDNSNRNTVNNNPSNIYISNTNKENINISNIFKSKNVVKKHIILNVDKIPNKNKEITHFPINKKPLTPLISISIKNKNKILNTESKAIQNNIINNKENDISFKKMNTNYIVSNYNDNNKTINPSKSFDRITINKDAKKELKNENKKQIIELKKPINSVLKYCSLSPNSSQKNTLFKISTSTKEKPNIKITQDLKKDNSTVFQKNKNMNFELRKLDNELNFKNMANNLVYISNNDKANESSILKRTKNYFDISNIYAHTPSSNKNITINTEIKSNLYKSNNKSGKNLIIVKSNLFNNDNRKKIESNKKNNYTITTNKKEESNKKLETYITKTSNIKKNNIREKAYLITPKKHDFDTKTTETDKHNKNKSNNDLTILPKKAFVNPYVNNNINYIKSCNSISVSGINEFGHKKMNQDTLLIERNVNGIFNFNIFGVLDGHGEDGHYVSQFVRGFIINSIKNNAIIKKCTTPKEVYEKLTANKYKLIDKTFSDADTQIRKEKFDYKSSGTTCVLIFQLEQKIICANTGDSRAIIVNNIKSKKITKVIPLSYDCRPELPYERSRIYEHGGEVVRTLDENDNQEKGPYRVYEKGKDYPGLAMSRSIGDIDAKKIGVIPNPQIIEYNIYDETKYMIICSDGVWEFISNEEVMEISNEYYIKNDSNGLCQCLFETSFKYWNDCGGFIVDDITAIVVFF